MRPLLLDYQRSTFTQHWVGVVVLLMVLAGAVQMGLYYLKISEEAERLETLATKIEQKLHPARATAKPSAAETQLTGAEIKETNDVVLHLSLPWDNLFSALEVANSSNIALLGIDPDAKNNLVRVSGEAKNYKALFSYMRHLQANKSIPVVYLKHHQIQEQDNEKPVRFSLDVSWK